MGVLITPSAVGGAPLTTSAATDGPGVVVPLPYPIPPAPYDDADRPFRWDAQLDTADRFGKFGTMDGDRPQ